MIQLSLVAVSIVLIGLQCNRLTIRTGTGVCRIDPPESGISCRVTDGAFRPTETLSPEGVRAILAQVQRKQTGKQ
jgi:hypothetical protein